MIRTAKVGLIIVAALWGFVGALGNILDWGQALGAVAAVHIYDYIRRWLGELASNDESCAFLAGCAVYRFL